MKMYLLDFKHGVQCKNKLQTSIADYAKILHRESISCEEVEDVLEEIRVKIDEFNTLHPRCKAEECYVYKNHNNSDMSISFGGDVYARISFLAFEII